MRLSKSASHAIRALVICPGSAEDYMKVADLCRRLGLAQANMFKIVRALSDKGLIDTKSGANGGVRLASKADATGLGDVVIALQTTMVALTSTGVRQDAFDRDVNAMLMQAREAFFATLNRNTIGDLRNIPTGPAPRRAKPQRAKRR